MGHTFLNRIIGIVTVTLLSFSCSSDLDFNQVNELNAKPVFTTNLAYLDLKASQFVVNGVEQSVFSYVANVNVLNNTFVENDLVKAEFFFKVNNTIDRAYIYTITLLDVNGSVIYPPITINVPAYKGIKVPVTKTVIFDGFTIDVLKNTTQIIFSVVMLPGTPLTPTSSGSVELSSSVNVYFDVK